MTITIHKPNHDVLVRMDEYFLKQEINAQLQIMKRRENKEKLWLLDRETYLKFFPFQPFIKPLKHPRKNKQQRKARKINRHA